MKRTAKKFIVAATIAAVSIQSAPLASACGGGGGRRVSYPSVYGGYPRAASNYRATLPATPPIAYSKPACNQPAYGHNVPNAPLAPPASTAPSAAAVQPRPRSQVALQSAAAANQQLLPTQQSAPTQQATPTQQVATTQQFATTQQVATTQQASQGTTPQGTATSTSGTSNAESSALAALASIANAAADPVAPSKPEQVAASVPQFTSAPSAASASRAPHVGVFSANLPSNVTIELRLNSGNTFSWIVRKDGKSTEFSGQYRITEGRLTLVRSKDLQQMAGKLTTGNNGFTFQLDGANNAGLEFKRV